MTKVKMDYKKVTPSEMVDFVATLPAEKRREFAKICIGVKRGEKVVEKYRSRRWIYENCDNVEWLNKPTKVYGKRQSLVNTVESWL